MRALRAIVVVLLVALGFLGGYFAGWYLHGENTVLGSIGVKQDGAKEAGDLQQRIIEELQNRYYRPVDVDKLSTAGVRGTLKSLDDPYTVYLTPEETKAFEEKQKGEYSGIGAALQAGPKGLVITSVFEGSPAEAAGLKPGDIIVEVDGEPTAGVAIETSIARIKGDEGTPVELLVKPKASGKQKTLTVTRRTIEIPETKTEMKQAGGEKVGYIQLYEFGGKASRFVREDVEALTKQGAQSFILDLRNNGGGLLSQAVDVTGIFHAGVVTSTKGLHSPLEVLESQGPVATGKPLVLLVNGYSASASEIVTGALKDSDRAEIIGTRTFGKGLVQSIIPLDGDAALKMTTAIYLTPNGTNINKKGITPDIIVVDRPKTKQDEQLQRALAYLAGLN
jgi:carboxyl-terminal processing protease